MQAFLLVVMIVVMESDKRGIVAGRGLSLYEGSTYLLRRYHGYVFSYIAIHQLWFHPWVRTQAHAIGLAHSVLLLTQSSLVFTKMHINPYWTLLLEVFLVLHAVPMKQTPFGYFSIFPADYGVQSDDTLAASRAWLSGFLVLLCVTQVHGLPVWKRVDARFRMIPLITVTGVVLALWQPQRFRGAHGALTIPAIVYIGALLFRSLLAGVCALCSCVSGRDFGRAQHPLLTRVEGEATLRRITAPDGLLALALLAANEPIPPEANGWPQPPTAWQSVQAMAGVVVLAGVCGAAVTLEVGGADTVVHQLVVAASMMLGVFASCWGCMCCTAPACVAGLHRPSLSVHLRRSGRDCTAHGVASA